jgi:hypothetical protein
MLVKIMPEATGYTEEFAFSQNMSSGIYDNVSVDIG